MAPKNITLLGQLDLSHENFTLKVRVIRLTKQLTYDKKKTFRIDMILVDEEVFIQFSVTLSHFLLSILLLNGILIIMLLF